MMVYPSAHHSRILPIEIHSMIYSINVAVVQGITCIRTVKVDTAKPRHEILCGINRKSEVRRRRQYIAESASVYTSAVWAKDVGWKHTGYIVHGHVEIPAGVALPRGGVHTACCHGPHTVASDNMRMPENVNHHTGVVLEANRHAM